MDVVSSINWWLVRNLSMRTMWWITLVAAMRGKSLHQWCTSRVPVPHDPYIRVPPVWLDTRPLRVPYATLMVRKHGSLGLVLCDVVVASEYHTGVGLT